jgi:broad specificity phosphatase PhoE
MSCINKCISTKCTVEKINLRSQIVTLSPIEYYNPITYVRLYQIQNTKSKVKTIHFIRHAESQANVGEATQNDGSIPLTEKGKQQAIALANSIPEKPDLIICSKFLRTHQTAFPLICKFPGVRVEVLPLHEFSYLSPAVCAGTTTNQRKNRVAAYWEQAGPDFVHGDGAESFNKFIQRIDHCLQCLEFCEARNIYVFAHGHVLRATWQILTGHKFSSEHERMHHFHYHMGQLQVPNTCIFKATFYKNEWQIIESQFKTFLC